jgi:hypothetical protein
MVDEKWPKPTQFATSALTSIPAVSFAQTAVIAQGRAE